MLLCAVPSPVASVLNALASVTDPDIVHAVAAWSDTVTFVDRDAVADDVPLYAALEAGLAFFLVCVPLGFE